MPPADERSTTERAVEHLRDEALRRLADVRLAGATIFLAVVSYLGLSHELDDWRIYVGPLAAYVATAIALRVAARPRLNALAVPFLDVPAVFLLQLASMPLSPHPAGVAGWSLGLFVFFAVLSALALDRQVLVATWMTTFLCEAVLQRTAGVGWGAVVASALVLGLAALVTAMVAHRLLSLIERLVASEVGRRVAEEQNLALEQANAEIARVNADLKEAQQNAETLTNLLVHDMKGPLAAMLGSIDLVGMRLDDGDPVEEMRTDLALGQRAGKRLLAMIGDLLGIASLENNAFRPARAASDLAEMIGEVAKDHAHAASSRGVSLQTSVAGDLVAMLDAQLVRRAVDNLVSNAISFAPEGQRVEIAAHRDGADSMIYVRNDGPAIPPDLRGRLFGKHAMHGARRGHNAGLGLYLCRLVANAHGGDIALVDEDGWSVSFAMRLPDGA